MLQIFLREAKALYSDERAGPFFYEIIQRCGDEGFGYGNFRALFESIERAQRRRRAAEHDRPPERGPPPRQAAHRLPRAGREDPLRGDVHARRLQRAVHVLLPSLPRHAAPRGRRDQARVARAAAGPRRRRSRCAGACTCRIACPRAGMLVDRRVPVLFNQDVTVLLARPDVDRRRVLRERRRRRALVRAGGQRRRSSRRAAGST